MMPSEARGGRSVVKRMALVLVAVAALVGVMATSGVAAPGPPTVVEVSPPYPAWRANPHSVVTATFSEEMRYRSINTSTFRLVQAGTGTPVESYVGLHDAGRKAVLYPGDPLAPGVYRATITQGAKDLEGAPLDQDPASDQAGPKVWTFTVADKPVDPTPLTVIDWSPPSEYTPRAATSNVTATFSEKVKPESVNSNTFTLAKSNADGTTAPIETAATYDPTTKTATLDPTADLEPGRYKATVTPGVRDLADHQLDQYQYASNKDDQPKEWWFTVTDAPLPTDTTPPTVTGVSPRGLIKDIYGSTYKPNAKFSEDMQLASINSTTVTLTKGGVDRIASKVTYDLADKRVYIDPIADMEPGEYTARVTIFTRDLAGNQFDQNATTAGNQGKIWNFTIVDSTP